jgi:hypothetical protein
MIKKPLTKKVTFVYPIALLERLRHLAHEHQRSLNGEVVWALRQYVQSVAHEQLTEEQQR